MAGGAQDEEEWFRHTSLNKVKLSTSAWIFNNAEFEVLSTLLGPFTVDICASANNAKVPRFFTRANSCLAHDLSGETIWCNPPWKLIGPVLEHYLKCKALAPETTSAVFVLPGYNAAWVDKVAGMHLVRSYPAGVQLFSIADSEGNRYSIGPTPWPVNVYWDPREGDTRLVKPTLGCIPSKDPGIIRNLRSLEMARKCHALVEEDLEWKDPTDHPIARSIQLCMASVSRKTLCGVPPYVLNGEVDGFPARLMLDDGADHNFISQEFVTKHKLQVTPLEGLDTVAYDGHSSACPGVVQNLRLSLGPFNYMLDAFVAPLGRYDIFLGTPWHKEADPVVSHRQRCITLSGQGTDAVTLSFLSENQTSSARVGLIAYTELSQLQQEGCQVFVGVVRLTTSSSEVDTFVGAIEAVSSLPTRPVLLEFKVVFDPAGKPQYQDIKMKIALVENAEPPKHGVRRMSGPELEEIKAQLQDHLEKGWIRPSSSDFGAPVLFVRKKDGSLRMCIDYRSLNKLTVKDRYPLPHLEELLDRLHGAKVFSKIDLQSGYHQVMIEEGDIHKTAFRTRYGQYEFTVIPFGLTNAPSVFMRIMNKIFAEYLDDFIVVFIDDILIYSRTMEEHLFHLRKALEVLRKHGFRAKLKKCQFGLPQVEFLGHEISEAGLSLPRSSAQAILEWPAPTNIEGVRTFLGFLNWVKKYIPRHAESALPISNLLSSASPWTWGPDQDAAFQDLKHKLITSPVLKWPDILKPFILITDASDHTISGILCQLDQDGDPQPCAYDSFKLKAAQLSWTVGEKEMFAGIRCMQLWRCYLLNMEFQWWTDHDNLRYWSTKAELSPRLIRWLDKLAEYKFEVLHIPGKSNPADALTRVSEDPEYKSQVARRQQLAARLGFPENVSSGSLHPPSLTSCAMKLRGEIQVGGEYLDRVRRAYATDPWFAEPDNVQDLHLENGLWYKAGKLCIPEGPTRMHLLREAHDSPTGGHWGRNKTMSYLRNHFFWPGLAKDVLEYVKTCHHCQINKARNHKIFGDPSPLGVPQGRWEEVSMDYMGGLPKSRSLGYDHVLVFVDRLSKMMHVVPVTSTVTAQETAELFLNHVARYHGLPKKIISDRDARFLSEFWKQLFDGFGTSLGLSTAYHPETDGQTEIYNRTLLRYLRTYSAKEGRDWPKWLWLAEFAYNHAVQASTGFSPFQLMYGENPCTPLERMLPTVHKSPQVKQLLDKLRQTLETARSTLQAAQDSQAQQLAQRRTPPPALTVGMQVALSTEHLKLPGKTVRKLREKWIGPVPITRVLANGNAVELNLPPRWKVSKSWNVKYVKPYNTSSRFPRDEIAQPPSMMVNNEEHWEVESILDSRTRRVGNRNIQEFLVKWLGWGTEHNDWLPKSELSSCKALLTQFLRQNPSQS